MLYLTPRYNAHFKVKLAVTYGMSTGNPRVLYTIHNFVWVNRNQVRPLFKLNSKRAVEGFFVRIGLAEYTGTAETSREGRDSLASTESYTIQALIIFSGYFRSVQRMVTKC